MCARVRSPMELNGTTYSSQTPREVAEELERCRETKTRVCLYYGKPGHLWGDVMTGRIGRSMGPCKIPILLRNSRSMAGEGILDDCVMGIRHANRSLHRYGLWLYRHPSLKQELTDLKTSHQAVRVKED